MGCLRGCRWIAKGLSFVVSGSLPMDFHSGICPLLDAARLIRQSDRDRRTPTQLTLDGKLAAHQLAIALGQREPEPDFVTVLARGLVFGPSEGLEQACKVDAIVFDKTGTITEGKPVVTDWVWRSEQTVLLKRILFSIESRSEHPLAEAITKILNTESVKALALDHFESITGRGVVATIDNIRYVIVHGMAPVAVLASLGQLGGELPPTYVVGCQPADVSEGIGLTPAVEDAVDGAVDLVYELLTDQLGLSVERVRASASVQREDPP